MKQITLQLYIDSEEGTEKISSKEITQMLETMKKLKLINQSNIEDATRDKDGIVSCFIKIKMIPNEKLTQDSDGDYVFSKKGSEDVNVYIEYVTVENLAVDLMREGV